ncbi:hypothetical protein AVEN_164482-1 [Araneus ventricosus]|uniref:Uncharacterized protein n=1 Tax=Araneus ventricosus TaxID=182803 RepID=A0A4Y2IR87_ARAVE|nr:hypothetical protein AVEN_164482-1 [Araneus ventricosus]
MKKKVQGVKGEIKEVKGDVQKKITEVEDKAQGKISVLEKRISDLRIRPSDFPANPGLLYSRPTVKSLTFDRNTSWTVFKTQYDVVSSVKGLVDRIKASQLVASLRGSPVEILRGIPADKLTDITTIEKSLESRF